MKNKIFKTLYYIFLSAIAVVLILVVVSAFPIAGNYQIKVVKSGSMEPALGIGSVVVIRPVSSYEVGDVVSFDGGFRLASGENLAVTHRIMEERVESGAKIFKTKGDANEDMDTEELFAGKIMGKVILTVPYVGYAVETAKKPYGFLALIVIPAAIIAYDQLAVIWKEIAKIRANKQKDEKATA